MKEKKRDIWENYGDPVWKGEGRRLDLEGEKPYPKLVVYVKAEEMAEEAREPGGGCGEIRDW